MTVILVLVMACVLPVLAVKQTTRRNPKGYAGGSGGWQTGPCTYHDYEGDKARFGKVYDNNPGWCGIRYSALDVSRVVAIGGMSASECAQCVEFQSASGAGPAVYVLAIDEKVAGGLDVALTSFQDAFPGSNPLDPQTCTWRFVDPSMCSGICFGSSLECTPGQRNLLPPQLLPPINYPAKSDSNPAMFASEFSIKIDEAESNDTTTITLGAVTNAGAVATQSPTAISTDFPSSTTTTIDSTTTSTDSPTTINSTTTLTTTIFSTTLITSQVKITSYVSAIETISISTQEASVITPQGTTTSTTAAATTSTIDSIGDGRVSAASADQNSLASASIRAHCDRGIHAVVMSMLMVVISMSLLIAV